MIDNQTAIMTIKKLAGNGGIALTSDDFAYLQGKYHKERSNEIRDAMFAGFFISASNGELFIPEGVGANSARVCGEIYFSSYDNGW